MEHLFKARGKIKKKIAGRFLFLFLDYDGTLTPIAGHPQQAVLPAETKKILKHIAAFPSGCKLAVISGRALKDIKRQIGLKGIIYAGNHGLEIAGPGIKFTGRVSLRGKAVIKQIADTLKNKLADISGVCVEEKGVTFSIHYRMVVQDKIALVKDVVGDTLKPYLERGEIRVNRGKQVVDVRPPLEWDKGQAVLWLLEKEQLKHSGEAILPVYIGDDITDEDAFTALKGRGLTIFVGSPANTRAQYFLKDTTEVLEFLREIREAICRH